ncbi:MAG: hypothetical protein ACRD28_03860 [Acidobacteriaceae bacterium]
MDRRQFLLSTGCLVASATVPRADAQRPDAANPGLSGAAIDYADASHVDAWLRHPVFGDPSFDNFQHDSANPIFRGSPPREWPVNGFYFIDPVNKNHYLYVGDYPRTYIGVAAHCILFRSTDAGKTWTKLPGWVVPEDPKSFDASAKGPGHAPDVTVVYFEGRYHMIYDWERLDWHEGGIAYAWADKPEGPFHRDPRPILSQSDHVNLEGRYSRPYGATLIRRRNDWLITGMLDYAPVGWAMFVITAPSPEGPWSRPVLVRHVETDYFHPPLLEGYPAFTVGKYLYAPTTSVARNRDFQCLFRAPIEQAHLPSAWSLDRHGSLWHSEDRENEYYGLWGQTFSGAVDSSGELRALFPSKDRTDTGTINIATRPWGVLFQRGFQMSAHTGKSLALLRKTCGDGTLTARFHLRGTARLLWDYTAPLGPDKPQSDATLHPLMLTRHVGLELGPKGWRIVRADDGGALSVPASGPSEGRQDWTVVLRRNAGNVSALIDGKEVWSGSASVEAGTFGWLLDLDTYLSVSEFSIAGAVRPVHCSYLFTEGWLDIAEDPSRWTLAESGDFRYGLGAVSRGPQAAAKWSVVGHRFTLYSPKGPDYGTIRVALDGDAGRVVDLHSANMERSSPVWSAEAKSGDYHAITIIPLAPNPMPLDCLEVSD